MKAIRAALAKARKKFFELRAKRRQAKPGGERRKRLAGLQDFWERRKRRLAKRLARLRRKPNWNGHTPVLGSAGARIVREANSRGLIVTSTTGGVHSTGSYHYQSRAIDFGVDWSTGVSAEQRTQRLIGLQYWLAKEYPSAREIFGPASFYIKNGARINAAFPNHGDHDHVAL